MFLETLNQRPQYFKGCRLNQGIYHIFCCPLSPSTQVIIFLTIQFQHFLIVIQKCFIHTLAHLTGLQSILSCCVPFSDCLISHFWCLTNSILCYQQAGIRIQEVYPSLMLCNKIYMGSLLIICWLFEQCTVNWCMGMYEGITT